MLALPLLAQVGCSDDEADDSTSVSGRGGQAGRGGQSGRGGASGHAGRNTGGELTGESGESSGGASGSSTVDEGGSGGVAGAAGEAGAGGAVALSDSEILKVVATANQGEIAAAQVAKAGAHAASVASFAQMMITDHSASNDALLALVSKNHIAPAASALSEHLEEEAATALRTLSDADATHFDATYMQSQVKMHQEVLTLLDNQLIPLAHDADLETLLVSTRATVATHLQQATTISAGL